MSISTPKSIFQRAQAVCFDVDSTVIQDEGIDVLAAHNGAGDAVAEWTKRLLRIDANLVVGNLSLHL